MIANRLNRNASMCEIVKGRTPPFVRKHGLFGNERAELGEPYIFKCGCMVKCSAAILFEEEMLEASLRSGPALGS